MKNRAQFAFNQPLRNQGNPDLISKMMALADIYYHGTIQDIQAAIVNHHFNGAFLQAVNVILNKPDFVKGNFVDINANDKFGMTVLHVAVLLNDVSVVKQLLNCGANPLLTDVNGHTPLKIAHDYGYHGMVETIVNHYLDNHDALLKFTDFTLFKAKNNGITVGGFYHDQNKKGWLLKEGHSPEPESVLNEYMAGAIYKLLLGENASQTEIVVDNQNGQLLIGSQLLANFKTLSQHEQDKYAAYNSWSNGYGESFPATYNGKPLKGFFDAISAIHFVADTDAHQGNVGLIDHGHYYAFAKIDHGFSFNFSWQPIKTLDDFRSHMQSYYGFNNLERVGYQEVYQAVSKIGSMNFAQIEQTVDLHMNKFKSPMKALGLKSLYEHYHGAQHGDLNLELNAYQRQLLGNLKQNHQNFQKISNFMLLEKGIIDHDLKTVKDALSKGVTLDQPFKPFFNPKLHGDYWNTTSEDVSGNSLAHHHWPDLFNMLNVNKPKGPVMNIHDIIQGPHVAVKMEPVAFQFHAPDMKAHLEVPHAQLHALMV